MLLPVYVLKQVNSNDDDGVLEGRWTQDYPKNTTPPWAWTGSKAILEEFMRNNKPVQYGQCWVFSAIVTSSENNFYIIGIHAFINVKSCKSWFYRQ